MTLATVGTYRSGTEASVVKAKLEAHGIEALVDAPVFSSSFPTLEILEGVKVKVHPEDLSDALEVLERMLPPGE